MNPSKLLFKLLLTLSLINSGYTVFAQQPAAPAGTDAAERASAAGSAACCGGSGPAAAAASGPRTSPFDPPEDNDHSFVTDAAPKLDTGCIYRSSGPIIFNVEITRHVGDLNPDGTLKNAAALVAAGLLSPTATLIMPAFDVDSGASVQGVAPERDRLSFNGQVLGFLTGENDVWKLNSFQIPIEKVRFAARGANGSMPSPALNEIRIDIDTANSQEVWCTSIDWGAQSFKAMSPIILIHGNGSRGAFFEDRGFTPYLRSQRLLYDNSINLGPPDFIVDNANRLDQLIPGIVKSFGVDSVHFVVHSKGGLDSREYLASHQPSHDNEFKVLSLTTLSTPHNGSVGADVSVERDAASELASKIEFEGFPEYTRQLAALSAPDNGRRNLTTTFVAGFNLTNIPRIAGSGTVFNTVAADADRNDNNQIDRDPDEFAELREEDSRLRNLDTGTQSFNPSRYIIDAVYQILRNTSGVTVTYRKQGICPVCRTVATITSIPNPTPLGNDTLVTIPSGQGVGSIQPYVSNSMIFTGAEGRNHASVANAGVAATVVPWIINVERTKGDLR
jgi:triacylglycerol lipase